ncbi:MAG: outer membrane beta-barrel protein [Bacteroidales bacterium]|nr:outer membrane beta-barrel protein [Bacteroidales bacterium]
MFLSVIAFAQKPVRFGVYLGGASPLGNVADGEAKKTTLMPLGDYSQWAMLNEEGSEGYAGVGADLGFDVTVALPVEGLGVFGGIDFFLNSNKQVLRDCIDEEIKEWEKISGNSKAKMNLPEMMNIPILFGVNYIHNFNNVIGIWGEAGIGPNFRLISKYEQKLEYSAAQPGVHGDFTEETTTLKYKTATTLGFKIGGGAILWDKMSIGLDFYALGSAKIEGSGTYKQGDNEVDLGDMKNFNGKKDISTSELVVRVGYHF